MKDRMPLSEVVLPDAVSPHTKTDMPFVRQSHRYAATLVDIVPHLQICVIDVGVSLNLRIVNDEPRWLTSSL